MKNTMIQVEIQTWSNGDFRSAIVNLPIPEEAVNIIEKAWRTNRKMRLSAEANYLTDDQTANAYLKIDDKIVGVHSGITKKLNFDQWK